MLKVERNMLHVTKTPKPYKKYIKAGQVTAVDDEALETNIKSIKIY